MTMNVNTQRPWQRDTDAHVTARPSRSLGTPLVAAATGDDSPVTRSTRAAYSDNDGDAMMAPWAMHTHLSREITDADLKRSMGMLRTAGYAGCWSVEHHGGTNEYSEVVVQMAQVRDMQARWATAPAASESFAMELL